MNAHVDSIWLVMCSLCVCKIVLMSYTAAVLIRKQPPYSWELAYIFWSVLLYIFVETTLCDKELKEQYLIKSIFYSDYIHKLIAVRKDTSLSTRANNVCYRCNSSQSYG